MTIHINEIRVFNKLRLNFESKFTGLPHAHSSLLKSLLNYADPKTGIVDGLSCRDLCFLLTVDPACGRKGSGVPKIETIRSYLRTIAANFPSDFKIVSAGQKLKLQFLSLPAFFDNYFAQNNQYGDESPCQLLDQNQSRAEINQDFCLDETTYFHEDGQSNPHITITNKQTNNYNNPQCKNKKRPISQDFFPDEKTIFIAKQKGLLKVTDVQEIQAFIQHNLKKKTKWSDYNPIFLQWLQREVEYRTMKQQMKTSDLRRKSSEPSSKSKKFKSRDDLLREVFEANREELETSNYDTAYFSIVDENDFSLRTDVCDEVWDERRWNMAFSSEGFNTQGTGGGGCALNAL